MDGCWEVTELDCISVTFHNQEIRYSSWIYITNKIYEGTKLKSLITSFIHYVLKYSFCATKSPSHL